MFSKLGYATVFGIVLQASLLGVLGQNSNDGDTLAIDTDKKSIDSSLMTQLNNEQASNDDPSPLVNDRSPFITDHELEKRPGARYIYSPSGYGFGGRTLNKRPGARYYYFNGGYGNRRMKRPGARYFAPNDNEGLLKRLGIEDRYFTTRQGYGRDMRWKRGGARYVGPSYYARRMYPVGY